MEIKRIFHQVKEAGERVLFGPKIEGVIVQIKRDHVNEELWHVLVRTKNDEMRHIIYPNRDPGLWGDRFYNGFIGKEFSERVRGKGIIMFPCIKYDPDPFRLDKNN